MIFVVIGIMRGCTLGLCLSLPRECIEGLYLMLVSAVRRHIGVAPCVAPYALVCAMCYIFDNECSEPMHVHVIMLEIRKVA